MPLIKYKDINFKESSLAIIKKANEIIRDMSAQGYQLTLRQLYYQFVAKALIENSERSYKRLGSVVTDGRLAGMIDWNAIEDRNRIGASEGYSNEDEEEAVRGIEAHIAYDYWARQENYVEVWVEKDALLGVIERACREYRVPHMACKGYLSASEAWRAGRRFKDKLRAGKRCVMLHLGDHDPSGLDMTRDNEERLSLFASEGVEVRRLALNMSQVEEYDPPPNPAKTTDSRSGWYIKEYGRESWELDALAPRVIDNLISNAVGDYIDQAEWDRVEQEEDEARKIVASVHAHWSEVRELLVRLEGGE